ncbi:hypothetical protein Dda_6144 [Drechslerella dactyloides]|uniref:Polyketide synthase n=1 Tax=Drechslerella dactyloides TaxID=74499 RepID=A0AAD6IX75_DREDA|nr:hypothetical protein Dda_6144 [Drechslerella dactyloides]
MEPLAIIGFAFKFPSGIESSDSFWDMMMSGDTGLSEVPEDRVNLQAFLDIAGGSAESDKAEKPKGYFMTGDVCAFDAPFFSITAEEAMGMDPQQRFLLETSYHALENDAFFQLPLANIIKEYPNMPTMIPSKIKNLWISSEGLKNEFSPLVATAWHKFSGYRGSEHAISVTDGHNNLKLKIEGYEMSRVSGADISQEISPKDVQHCWNFEWVPFMIPESDVGKAPVGSVVKPRLKIILWDIDRESILSDLDEEELAIVQTTLSTSDNVLWIQTSDQHSETSMTTLLSQLDGMNLPQSLRETITGDIEFCRLKKAAQLTEHVQLVRQSVPKPALWGESGSLKITIGSPGILDTIHFVEDAESAREMQDNEVEVEVKAAGVNFKDCLIALGALNEDKIGDRVCGFAADGYRKFYRTEEPNLSLIPSSLTFAEAARGTGQAAIQIANHLGATIYTTVSTQEKRDFLTTHYKIPSERIFNSRDTKFADDIIRLAGGVDVVLNSLSGDTLFRSWECMAPFGRFVEIGKKDIQAYGHLHRERPKYVANLVDEALGLFGTGGTGLRPVRELRKFDVSNTVDAFRLIGTGKTIGKIVVEMNPESHVPVVFAPKRISTFSPNASYVIAGGLGGLGRVAARWMAERGAKHLILLSRSGPRTAEAHELMDELEKLVVTSDGYLAENEAERELLLAQNTYQGIQTPEFHALLDYYCDSSLPLLAMEDAQVTLGIQLLHKDPDLDPFGTSWGRNPMFQALRLLTSADSAKCSQQSSGKGDIGSQIAAAKTKEDAIQVIMEEMDQSKPIQAYGVDSLQTMELRRLIEGAPLEASPVQRSPPEIHNPFFGAGLNMQTDTYGLPLQNDGDLLDFDRTLVRDPPEFDDTEKDWKNEETTPNSLNGWIALVTELNLKLCQFYEAKQFDQFVKEPSHDLKTTHNVTKKVVVVDQLFTLSQSLLGIYNQIQPNPSKNDSLLNSGHHKNPLARDATRTNGVPFGDQSNGAFETSAAFSTATELVSYHNATLAPASANASTTAKPMPIVFSNPRVLQG